ncbi:KRAB-A domain-containing protein 2-like [Metopolophium dirhodum]|uniref:KRAB-A domain-containing protein 2-like n=1 Tax=Metopolophium dirhodum TaxID=44670 RepID=UPI00299009A4|nr:KRAB-A domain-containing protein 2-like [Metopolophium dirhodum]
MNEFDLMKEKFYMSVKNRSLKPNSAVLTKEKYASLMIDVKKMKIKKESSRDYWLEKHYAILRFVYILPAKKKKDIVVKPMVFGDFNSRCQIDLIDFQSQSDAGYKFVLVYQDHLTKFCILRPLKCKRAEQIAYLLLLDIFCLFGAPSVL